VADKIVSVMHAIVTVVTGVVAAMLCGGSGVALLGTGPLGFVIGGLIAAAAVILGKGFVKEAAMSMNIPKLLRHLFPESIITSQSSLRKTAELLSDGLSSDPDLTGDLVEQVGQIIDDSITELIRDSEGRIVA